MASKRCLPTRFFKDADVMNLSKDAQLILVGLVLLADDEGRELAHAKLLGRELDYPQEVIEAALAELTNNDLIVLYQAGKHRYYNLTRWPSWQSLSAQKMTPSKHPAPPVPQQEREEGEASSAAHESEAEQDAPSQPLPASPDTPQGTSDLPPGNSGKFWESPSQVNRRESKSSQGKRIKEEGPPPSNIVPFRAAPLRDDDDTAPSSPEELGEVTERLAAILHLPLSEGLARLMDDYLHTPGLSLLGQADAAREWIDDAKRNRTGQTMSLAFFRRWLSREDEAYQRRQQATVASAGRERDSSRAPRRAAATSGVGPLGRSGPGDGDHPYQSYVQARVQAALQRVRQHPPQEEQADHAPEEA